MPKDYSKYDPETAAIYKDLDAVKKMADLPYADARFKEMPFGERLQYFKHRFGILRFPMYAFGVLMIIALPLAVMDMFGNSSTSLSQSQQSVQSQQDDSGAEIELQNRVFTSGTYYPARDAANSPRANTLAAQDWERLCDQINGVTQRFRRRLETDGFVVGIVKRDFSEMLKNGLPYDYSAFSLPSDEYGKFDESGLSRRCLISIKVTGIHNGSQKAITETVEVGQIVVNDNDTLAHNYGYAERYFALPTEFFETN